MSPLSTVNQAKRCWSTAEMCPNLWPQTHSLYSSRKHLWIIHTDAAHEPNRCWHPSSSLHLYKWSWGDEFKPTIAETLRVGRSGRGDRGTKPWAGHHMLAAQVLRVPRRTARTPASSSSLEDIPTATPELGHSQESRTGLIIFTGTHTHTISALKMQSTLGMELKSPMLKEGRSKHEFRIFLIQRSGFFPYPSLPFQPLRGMSWFYMHTVPWLQYLIFNIWSHNEGTYLHHILVYMILKSKPFLLFLVLLPSAFAILLKPEFFFF